MTNTPVSTQPEMAPADIYKRVFVVLLGTKTPEKIIHYNTSARLQNIPIIFIPFDQIALFHSADEELGDRVAHAHGKLAELDKPIQAIGQSAEYENAVRRVCAQYGVSFDPQLTYGASEDSSLGIPQPRWEATKSIYDDHLPSEIITNAERDVIAHDGIDDVFQGPGSEIGPIMGAMGMAGFFRAATYGLNPNEKVLTLDIATMVVRRLDEDSTSPVKEITGKQINVIKPVAATMDKQFWLDLSFENLSLPGHLQQTIADDMEDYLRSHSPRAKIVRELYAYMLSQSYDISAAAKLSAQSIFAFSGKKKVRVLSPRMPEYPLPTLQKSLHGFNEVSLDLKRPPYSHLGQLKRSPYWDALSLSRNLDPSNRAFLFAPDKNIVGALNGKAKTRSLQSLCSSGYVFFSALVEKQIEPASANVPLVIMNDGSYDALLDLYRTIINSGMSKDIDFLPVYEKDGKPVLKDTNKNIEGVQHKALGMMDVVFYEDGNTPYPQRLANAAAHVLNYRLKNTYPYQGLPTQLKHKIYDNGIPYRRDLMKVAVLTSASNDNLILLSDNKAIGNIIAHHKCGLVWGAGDRHGMGAVYDGYLEADGPWLEGYSTPTILIGETKLGRMPSKCHYSEISPDIFHRMAKIIENADVIAMTPGGIGTVQEMLAVFKLMYEAPHLMQGKSFIFHNPVLWGDTPFMDPIIKTFLGEYALQELKETGHLRGTNIYMTSDVESFEHLIESKNREWNHSLETGSSRTFSAKTSPRSLQA